MVQIVIDVRVLRRIAVVLFLVTLVVAGVVLIRSAWADVDDPPLPSVAVVARADNPVDALAASAVAGQLGAPVVMTWPTTLVPDARATLEELRPDVVVIAGGDAAISRAVEDEIATLLPDARMMRRSGADRNATARLLNALPAELGFGRPVLTGATVPGDAGVAGELTLAGTDVAATLADLQARIDELESLLAGVTRITDDVGNDTLRLAAMNVQLVNGEGATDTSNGLGNLILGYNAPNADTGTSADDRAGSHVLVVGDGHHWTRFGGIVAGLRNTISGEWASVTGGARNIASGDFSFGAGGTENEASGNVASVVGGQQNTASGQLATALGGGLGSAAGDGAVVSGGQANTASGNFASVTGGLENTASGDFASVTAGWLNVASGTSAAVSGGAGGEAIEEQASISGGVDNLASAPFSSVSGGRDNTASGPYASVTGGRSNEASGESSAVSGGHTNSAAGDWSSIVGGQNGSIPDTLGGQYDSLIGDQLFGD